MGPITIWGLIMALIAVILLIAKGLNSIYQAFVITSPLFTTIVTAIPLGNTVLRSSYFFAAIYIVFYASILAVRKKNSHVDNVHDEKLFFRKDLIPIYTFLLIITGSLFMPFFLKNDVSVISFESSVGLVDNLKFERLEFRQSNLTQLIYPLFQIILLSMVASYITARNNVRETIDLLVKGSYVVLATGVLHIIFVQVGGTGILQAIKFAISGESEVKLSAREGLFGLARMHSWAGEPGYTSFLFLAILGIGSGGLLTGNYIIYKNQRQAIRVFMIFISGIILSTGTTGYVGIIILFSLAFIGSYAIPKGHMKIKRRYLVIPVAGVIILFVVMEFATGFSFLGYFQEQHVSKLTDLSGSGLVRFTIVAQNFQNFLESPIIGLGYGSERSLALSAFLLSNTGLAGFLSFTFFGLFLMIKMWEMMKSSYATADQRTLALGLFISFGTMFSLMQFAKSESSLLFHYFWIIAACMLAFHRIFKSQKKALIDASNL